MASCDVEEMADLLTPDLLRPFPNLHHHRHTPLALRHRSKLFFSLLSHKFFAGQNILGEVHFDGQFETQLMNVNFRSNRALTNDRKIFSDERGVGKLHPKPGEHARVESQ
jgi:hypothetical protein